MPGLAARCADLVGIVLEPFRAQGPASGYRQPHRTVRADLRRLAALDGAPRFGADDRSGAPYIREHFPEWAGTIAPDWFVIVCRLGSHRAPEREPGAVEPTDWRGPYVRLAEVCAALTEHLAAQHSEQP